MEVIEQNCKPDGDFPLGAPDPLDQKVLARLGEGVRKHKADLGLGYDCDGDRVAVVDGDGQPILIDLAIALIAKDIIARCPGAKIVYTVMCTRALKEAIDTAGGESIMWKVGHTLIHEKCLENRALLGGESSGHIFIFDDFYGHDDAINASLRILDYLSERDITITEAVAELPKYISSPTISMEVADNIKFSFIETTITDKMREIFPNAELTDIDGVRIDTTDQMVCIRASNTGANIKLVFEAKSQERYGETKALLAGMLKDLPEINWQGSNSQNTEALFD